MDTVKKYVEMQYVVEGDAELDVAVEGQYYRVVNIALVTGITEAHKLLIKYMPLSYGLAIEEKIGEDSYRVVCTCEWDDEKKKVLLKDVDFRSINTLEGGQLDKIDEYINSVQFARQALLDVHESK